MRHKPTSQEQLLELLDDIRERVAAGDSFEGSLEYLMPGPEPFNGPEFEGADFAARASYRVGNSMGQGGVSLFGIQEPT